MKSITLFGSTFVSVVQTIPTGLLKAKYMFFCRFDFSTVGIRKNYYKDGSHALLKEKKLTTK